MTSYPSNLLLYFLVFIFVCLALILGFYWIFQKRRLNSKLLSIKHIDPRFMGSTAFLVGLSGLYKGAVIPIPMEGVMIGSDVNEANIVISDSSVSGKHLFVSFPAGKYNAVLTEDLGNRAGTFYLEGQGSWIPLHGSKQFSQSSIGKIRIGTNEEIFEITFRL